MIFLSGSLVGRLGFLGAMTDFPELPSEQLVCKPPQQKSALVFCSECFFSIRLTRNMGYYFGWNHCAKSMKNGKHGFPRQVLFCSSPWNKTQNTNAHIWMCTWVESAYWWWLYMWVASLSFFLCTAPRHPWNFPRKQVVLWPLWAIWMHVIFGNNGDSSSIHKTLFPIY